MNRERKNYFNDLSRFIIKNIGKCFGFQNIEFVIQI